MKLFTVISYNLTLIEKFNIDNKYLPLINLKNIIENFQWLMEIVTVNEYNQRFIKKINRECLFINLRQNNKIALGSDLEYRSHYQVHSNSQITKTF